MPKLHEHAPILKKGHNFTAYFLYDEHVVYSKNGEPVNLRALKSETAVYNKLEELYRSGKISRVFVEGCFKGTTVLDDIPVGFPGYEQSQARTYQGSRRRFNTDADLTKFILMVGGDAKVAFTINYAGSIPVIGWESIPSLQLVEERVNIFQRIAQLEKVKEQITTGSIAHQLEEHEQYIQEERRLEEEILAIQQRRSREAYFNPLECATTNSLSPLSYAVVVGRAHRPDILEIITREVQHPKIVDFVWM